MDDFPKMLPAYLKTPVQKLICKVVLGLLDLFCLQELGVGWLVT